MSYIIVNVVAILPATCAGLVVGIVFRMFAGRQVNLPERHAGRRLVFLAITALVAEFWLCSILAGALILAPQQADPWVMALGSAVVIWVGFIVPVLTVTHLFRSLSPATALLDSGHWLVVLLTQATVLHLVGLVRVA